MRLDPLGMRGQAAGMRSGIDRRTAVRLLGAAGMGVLFAKPGAVLAGEPAATKALAGFKPESRELLASRLGSGDFSGKMEGADVQALAGIEGRDVSGIMLALLPLAQTYARPPISNFYAGAVVRGASGAIYLGANLEFPGQPLGFTVHGEQAAFANAYMHDEAAVVSLAGSDAPCGHCRQFMYEMAPTGELEVVVAGSGARKLSALLPEAFGPKDLGFKDGAFPVRQVGLKPAGMTDALGRAALAAAQKSYAPYTKAYAGVALETREGRRHAGSYLENAAFNPGLPPLQTALISLVLAGGEYARISRVCLAETKDAVISHREVTEAILRAIAPDAKLQVVKAET